MKKQVIVGHSGNVTMQPSEQKALMYECSAVERRDVSVAEGSLVHSPDKGDIATDTRDRNSVGNDYAAFGGCNANNGNASASTLNSNNALSNSNGNYAGAFAAQYENNEKHVPARPTRAKTTEEDVATGGHPCGEYDIPPFCDDMAEEITRMIAETRTNSDLLGKKVQDPVWDELRQASSKRKIKNFKRFFTNRTIVRAGIARCIEKASESKARTWLENNRNKVEDLIIEELTNETYRCQPPYKRKLQKLHPDDKDRYTEIYHIYDRCVQNIMLIVLTPKLVRLIPRTCYSGIVGRSLFSNDKTFCMINQIRTACIKHPGGWAGLTDIHHFYDTLQSKVVLGVAFKTVVCRFTRWLLSDLLLTHPTLTIGGTLSQLLAMMVLADLDNEICKRFKPQFYGSFGDNRIIIDDDKQKVVSAVHFSISYVEGRYALSIKDDWQIMPVRYGFRYCKYGFKKSFVRIRSKMRRRAIKAFRKGKQNFAGYLGILQKTDSKRLIRFIVMGNINSKGMAVRKMIGTPVKIPALVGKTILITDWLIIENQKPSEYYIKFQCMAKDENENVQLNVCANGSHEIKEYFKLVAEGKVSTDVPVHVLCEGNTYYFEGYHTTEKEALDILRSKFNF